MSALNIVAGGGADGAQRDRESAVAVSCWSDYSRPLCFVKQNL